MSVRFRKESRRSPIGYFECGDTTHFIVDCPRGRSVTPSTTTTTPSEMTTARAMIKKHQFRDNKKVLKAHVLSVCCLE
jgi:hypothetical protein